MMSSGPPAFRGGGEDVDQAGEGPGRVHRLGIELRLWESLTAETITLRQGARERRRGLGQ
jgi:hypothetical protein